MIGEKYMPEVGDIIRPKYPVLSEFIDRNDLTVEWVGVNGNQIVCAGLFATAITVDGRQRPDPHYGILTDFAGGKGWTKVGREP